MMGKFMFLALLLCFGAAIPLMEDPRSVFTIAYTRYFRKDKIAHSMGCGKKVAYSSWTFKDGARDALHISTNPHGFGGVLTCNPVQTFAKVLGYAQDYDELTDAGSLAQKINSLKQKKVIIDWKKGDKDLGKWKSFLNSLFSSLTTEAYLKVPASYLCRLVDGSPYILGLSNVKKIIVEMYGENPQKYKTASDIFTDTESTDPTTTDYPDASCPKFPSYKMLSSKYPNIEFYIEKTLQQEEPGYLGEQFESILEEASNDYKANKLIFYDAYPPNLIHI